MKYKELYEIFYSQKDKYEDEYKNRFNSETTIILPIDVNEQRAFISNTPILTLIIEKINYNAIQITRLANSLPKIAIDFYRRSCLIDEILMSNDIEGVQSSRAEIKDAMADNSKATRFRGMARKYEKLFNINSEVMNLDTVRDIRILYDDIVSEEIEKENILDGELFRKKRVYVRDAKQDIIHEGAMPEERIIEDLANVLAMLKDESIPVLYRIAAFHYYIGYVHPFYDGNGRVSRFISSYLIGNEIHPLIALSLSMSIKENKKKYYKAFKIANDPKNKADLTSFIIRFLEFILYSTEKTLDKLSLGKSALDGFDFIVKEKFKDKTFNKSEFDMLWFLAQNMFFSADRFNIKELQFVMGKSWQTVKKTIESLLEKGVPITMKKQGYSKIIEFDTTSFIDRYSQLKTSPVNGE